VRGDNHHFNRNPETRANHAAAVSTEEYRDKFRGEKNPMHNPGTREAQLAAVRTPAQRALRRDNMNKLHADPAFVAEHQARLKGRTQVIARGNLLFGGADAACRYFSISKPTLAKHIAAGTHGFCRVGTAADVAGAVCGGYAVDGVWSDVVPAAAEKLPHGLAGKPSNACLRPVSA
jgi:hypothetical protein